MEAVKAILFFGTLFFIAVYDQRTHNILLISLVPIVIAALILPVGALPMAWGAVTVSLPMLILAKVSGGIGMGDVYLMAAIGLVLGPQKVVFATICGLTLFLIYYAANQKSRVTPYAMAPWLSAGAVIAYLI